MTVGLRDFEGGEWRPIHLTRRCWENFPPRSNANLTFDFKSRCATSPALDGDEVACPETNQGGEACFHGGVQLRLN